MLQVQQNTEDGIALLQTAEGGLEEVQKLLERLRDLAAQASNGTYDAETRESMQAEADQIIEQISQIRDSIKYDNQNLYYKENNVKTSVTTQSRIMRAQVFSLSAQSDTIEGAEAFTGGETRTITIDGVNIKNFRIHDLRALIGNVNQEAILFNDTFFNNIAFGVENATMEQVIEAAKIANAHDFIMETELGYQTNIGDRGGKLSGGQRQRISIARAILKNPPILILDEATSALDTESERLVQEALERLMKTRTTIAIAHRLSTIKNADEICVLYEGEIVERGKHEELLEKNGYYKRLNDMQSLS